MGEISKSEVERQVEQTHEQRGAAWSTVEAIGLWLALALVGDVLPMCCVLASLA